MSTTCSGDARSARRHETRVIAYCGRRAPRRAESSSRTPRPVAWADSRVCEKPFLISCNTLLEKVLADTRFVKVDRVVAWTDGTCACNQDARLGCVVDSSALVTPGIGLSPHLDVSKPTTVRNLYWQSTRCVFMEEISRSGLTASMSCVLLLNSCLQCRRQQTAQGNADLCSEFAFAFELKLKTIRHFHYVRRKSVKTRE